MVDRVNSRNRLGDEHGNPIAEMVQAARESGAFRNRADNLPVDLL